MVGRRGGACAEFLFDGCKSGDVGMGEDVQLTLTTGTRGRARVVCISIEDRLQWRGKRRCREGLVSKE